MSVGNWFVPVTSLSAAYAGFTKSPMSGMPSNCDQRASMSSVGRSAPGGLAHAELALLDAEPGLQQAAVLLQALLHQGPPNGSPGNWAIAQGRPPHHDKSVTNVRRCNIVKSPTLKTGAHAPWFPSPCPDRQPTPACPGSALPS